MTIDSNGERVRARFGEFGELTEAASKGEKVDFVKLAEMGVSIFSQQDLLEDVDEDDWTVQDLWDVGVIEYLTDAMDLPDALKNPDFVSALITLGQFDAHLLCLMVVTDLDNYVMPGPELKKVSLAEECEHDTGRTESCIGWKVYLARHINTPAEVLEELNSCDHHDVASIQWALAMNPSTPSFLLSEYAHSDDFGWRIQGDIEEYGASGVSPEQVPAVIQSYLRWAVAGNPSLPAKDREALTQIHGSDLVFSENTFGWSGDPEVLAAEIRFRATN
jgi:hypothetical protein